MDKVIVNDDFFNSISKRYFGATKEALKAVMCPLLIPILELDSTPEKFVSTQKKITDKGEKEIKSFFWRASFKVKITQSNATVMAVGRTGKFVPGTHDETGEWREIAKGRLISVDFANGVAVGEIYTGDNSEKSLLEALVELTENDLWEVDQYGASAKILSALAEHFLVEHGLERGYQVTRMPEDMARHLGSYANYDFQFSKKGKTLGVEAKSIWGTDTNFARLIHSLTTPPKGDPASWTVAQKKNYYPTSSCKFATQDIFAVNLFLRTGNIRDFAFARSISNSKSKHGLPECSGFPEHVTQNPRCEIDNVVWFKSIDEVWDLI